MVPWSGHVGPPVMTDWDHEPTNTFNQIEYPPHLCIRNGPSEHDGPSWHAFHQKMRMFTRGRWPVINVSENVNLKPPEPTVEEEMLARAKGWPHQGSTKVRVQAPQWGLPGYQPITASAPQLNTCVHRTAPASVNSPLQHSPGPTVLHSPPSLPVGGDKDGSESFNDSLVSSHIPLGSGLCTMSSVRDNRAFFRQTWHLNDHNSAWHRRWNSQATQWKLVAIPRLMPTYLANHMATESGGLPPPRPNHQFQCKKEALKVEMVTWNCKFSPHLLRLLANCVLHQDPRKKYCLPASAIQL